MGDRAWLVRLLLPPEVESSARLSAGQKYGRMLAARSLVDSFESVAGQGFGLDEVVAGADSVLVPYDPTRVNPELLRNWLAEQSRQAIARWHLNGMPASSGRGLHRLPVVYGGEYGPDLAAVARRNNLTPEEVVRRHSAAIYTVYIVGFAPGFAYMGALPAEIDAPRLERPRPKVPAGTVALAAGLTGIYPLIMPGGWNLIGYTPWPLFDPAQDPPVRFLPGDRVQFYPISEDRLKNQYESIMVEGRSLRPTQPEFVSDQ